MLELKPKLWMDYQKEFDTFNRTMLELKHGWYHKAARLTAFLLIEPCWN